MYRRKRVLILASSVIMLCLCLIAGATYALFDEEAVVSNHLQAGNLDIQLIRNSYEYKVLDNSNGRFKVRGESNLTTDFTQNTNENFFGVDRDELLVPGSYAMATFTVKNAGTTAFSYNIALAIKETSGTDYTYSKSLADQLYVTIGNVNADGSLGSPIISGYLNDDNRNGDLVIASGANGLSEFVAKGSSEQTMYIHVVFENKTNNDINNAAQNGQVDFDLVIVATQDTE